MTNCWNYSESNIGSRISEYYVNSLLVGVSETRNIFKITLPQSYYAGCYVEIFSSGLIQGKGAAVKRTTFLIANNNLSPATVDASTYGVDAAASQPGTITHGASVSGYDVTFTVTTNGTIAGSNIYHAVKITGFQFACTLLDSFN